MPEKRIPKEPPRMKGAPTVPPSRQPVFEPMAEKPEMPKREWRPRARQRRNKVATSTFAVIAGMLPTLQAAEAMAPGVIPPGTSVLVGSLLAGLGGIYNHFKKDD